MQEEEIQKIRNDPVAMKNKLETLFDQNKIAKVTKKLPPLEFSKQKTGLKNDALRRDLTSLKAPILQNQHNTERSNIINQNNTHKNGNDTDSEVDIHDQQDLHNALAKPSYNPQLLKDEK